MLPTSKLNAAKQEAVALHKYTSAAATKLQYHQKQGLATHYLNSISIKLANLLVILNNEKADDNTESTKLPGQLELDLAEAASDAGHSGQPE